MYQGQLVVKNAMKVDTGLRASRPNPKRAGNDLGEIWALLRLSQYLLSECFCYQNNCPTVSV